jgi:large subunit ribosomal protein L9
MEVILSQDVEKIGKAGSVVKVKDGFARNFLLPNKLAVPLTQSNLKKLEQEKEKKAQILGKIKQEAEELKTRLANYSLTLTELAKEEDQLYGSITAQDIVNALAADGFAIDKSAVALDEPIKALGIYEIVLKLHSEVQTKIKVWVVKK